MATRARPARQAAQSTNYTFDESDGSADAAGSASSDEEEYGRKRAKTSKNKGKARMKTPDESGEEEEEESEGGSSTSAARKKRGNPYLLPSLNRARARWGSPAPELVEYEVKRVDFSKTLPVETVAEILSYLGPKTLYELSFLNKTFHAILTSPTVKPVWKRAYTFRDLRDDEAAKPRGVLAIRLEKRRIPADPQNPQNKLLKFCGVEVEPYRLAVLMFESACQLCGEDTVERPDQFLFRRICKECRTRSFIGVEEVVLDKKYEGLHAATLKVVPKTSVEPDRRFAVRCTDFVYLPELYETSDMLEEIDYAADGDKPWRGAELDLQSIGRDLSRAAKLADSWRDSRQQKAKGIEQRIMAQFSPRLTRWIVAAYQRLGYREDVERAEGRAASEQARAERFARISQRVKQEGIFDQYDENRLVTHPLVGLAEPLTDDVWHAIAAAIYLDLGRAAAKDLIARSVKGQGRPSQAAEGPWAYIHPAFPDIVARSKEREERAKENEREERELARKQKRLDSKHAFLRDRYDAILADIPSDEVRALAPCFRDFLHLDNVKDLHDDAEIATEKSRANQDLQVFQERLDAVRDEMNGFAIDVRLHALKLILAATTDTSEEEIEQLDVDKLSDPRFDDDFFRRPSSWINCGGDYCSNTGPLVDVLKHWHERHEPDLPDRLDDPVLRFEEDEEEKNPNTSPERLVQLSLEVACAWSALLELGRIDGDDPNVTKEDVEETFKSFRFVWENCPSHKGFPRETWSSLLGSVKYATREAREAGKFLPPPIIAMKDLNSRERRMAERDAEWAKRRTAW
ncbi:hypothetical protein JCM10049v2_006358 [Rhodotorula toruloides]